MAYLEQWITDLQKLTVLDAIDEIANSGLSDAEIGVCVRSISEGRDNGYKFQSIIDK